ncbi:putative U32 family peptidase [Lapidilactobacillus concavus DSM 17758]|uniref:Putative U32 family peptidase n=1 Tax=Lapidilactobacillus concavus DSM 17758 TaxID=1423735 RepID=A0A0R1W4W4_9LACO|nr:peptidase U32 family protein [Lapidilactobacillus concavus]KRM12695.1 putative U32 family peptidase [Lapidilactobacillus concavus DSM 17758]GEL13222.1 peptidase U32 [Lapidilactobacillus concavus]
MRTELVATVASLPQAKALLEAGADRLYLGEDYFGLRLPHSFDLDELAEVVQLTHQHHKKVTVAVNAIFHNDRIKKVGNYLRALQAMSVDEISVGDPGVIYLLQQLQITIPYIYDAADLVTSSRQINFWAKHQATAAVLAREVPYEEMVPLSKAIKIPVEVLVYGATVIHQSGRPLLRNYSNFVQEHLAETDRERGLFIAAPHHPETHYSIYEDVNGTHVFANNDVDLMTVLPKLWQLGLRRWKLDGLYADSQTFPQIVVAFDQARQLLDQQDNSVSLESQLQQLDVQVTHNQPNGRGLDLGFFDLDPNEVK